MSSGPGILQKRILDYLRNHPSVFYNQLLWDLAFERKEIQGRSTLSPHIEQGIINKSFKNNFFRSIESLAESKIVNIEKRVLTKIDEAFEYFPYHTDRLEIHQLRLALLPVLREYIIEENPHKFGSAKIEEELISRIQADPSYSTTKDAWESIEKEIIAILDTESPLYDSWIQILVRGRYLFLSAPIQYKASFKQLYLSLNKEIGDTGDREGEILKHIRELITLVFDNDLWKLGKTKAIYYDMANMKQYHRDSLKDDVKKYLALKRSDIVQSLPGHKEPGRHTVRGVSYFGSREPTYSDYLDHLLTRQILRKQKIIALNLPSS
jgi:hypothetical protein